jgi:hypothetical protein
MSLGSLTVGMSEDGNFVELFEPYVNGLEKTAINLTMYSNIALTKYKSKESALNQSAP